jgi:hypothetical protein
VYSERFVSCDSAVLCLLFASLDGAGPLVVTSRKGGFSGLGLNFRTLLCAGRVGVRTGVFSRSSGSIIGKSLASDRISTPLLLLAEPLIPVFLGDDDRGGGMEVPRSDLRVDRTSVGARPVPVESPGSVPK